MGFLLHFRLAFLHVFVLGVYQVSNMEFFGAVSSFGYLSQTIDWL